MRLRDKSLGDQKASLTKHACHQVSIWISFSLDDPETGDCVKKIFIQNVAADFSLNFTQGPDTHRTLHKV